MDSTKRHEYNHNAWKEKYGVDAFSSTSHKPVTWDAKNFNPSLNVNDGGYYASPWEINARARQWSHVLNKKSKTPEDLTLLNELEITTKPYLQDFAKRYPDEVGAKLHNRLTVQKPKQSVLQQVRDIKIGGM